MHSVTIIDLQMTHINTESYAKERQQYVPFELWPACRCQHCNKYGWQGDAAQQCVLLLLLPTYVAVNNLINIESVSMESQQWVPFGILAMCRCQQYFYK